MSMSEPAGGDRWQAPDFPQSGMLTAADLEALQEQAYEEARAEGLAKGIEEGREQGLAEAAQELAARRDLLEATLDYLAAPLLNRRGIDTGVIWPRRSTSSTRHSRRSSRAWSR